MADVVEPVLSSSPEPTANRHRRWVRLSHALVTICFCLLTFSGVEILMVHPRLYWGETGNDLMPALFELPIGRNYHHAGWQEAQQFEHAPAGRLSASRTYEIFNENGWGRSLHFLSAWILVITGVLYMLAGFATRHFRNRFRPYYADIRDRLLLKDFMSHFKRLAAYKSERVYPPLQKYTYITVIFLLFPVVILTGLTMSPAITAAYPFLLTLFAGAQSARTIHFFAAVALLLFLILHITMVIRSGFKNQVRAITIGG